MCAKESQHHPRICIVVYHCCRRHHFSAICHSAHSATTNTFGLCKWFFLCFRWMPMHSIPDRTYIVRTLLLCAMASGIVCTNYLCKQNLMLAMRKCYRHFHAWTWNALVFGRNMRLICVWVAVAAISVSHFTLIGMLRIVNICTIPHIIFHVIYIDGIYTHQNWSWLQFERSTHNCEFTRNLMWF